MSRSGAPWARSSPSASITRSLARPEPNSLTSHPSPASHATRCAAALRFCRHCLPHGFPALRMARPVTRRLPTSRASPQTAGFYPSPNGLSCVLCDPQAGSQASFANGFALTAAWQPAGLSGGRCACAAPGAASVVVAMEEGGRRYSRCMVCPAGTAADAAAGVCSLGPGEPRTPDGDLAYVVAALNAKGAGISLQMATQVGLALHEGAMGYAAATWHQACCGRTRRLVISHLQRADADRGPRRPRGVFVTRMRRQPSRRYRSHQAAAWRT
jgi:hypothetical protein